MNKTIRVLVVIVYALLIILVNVVALLFLLMAFSGAPGEEGAPASILGVPGKYGMLYHLAAIFAPACIALSLGRLLQRAADFNPAFLRRMFRVELTGLIIVFLVLLLTRYFKYYRWV